jgi:RND family efflux transporter MFP subunit
MFPRGLLSLLAVCGLAAGCHKQPIPMGSMDPPKVVVSPAVVHEVTDYEEFTGRTDAVKTVEVRAMVSGYLDKIHFKDGSLVRQGDLLFEIDPRPFRAELERTEANLAQAESRLKRMEADFQRGQEMLQTRAIGREEFDRITSDRAEARSAAKAALAARNTARLNLEYSRIIAPITGKISKRNVDPGNMVKSQDTPLTLIVTVDPMYANFDVDERTYLRIQRYLEKKELSPSQKKELPVEMALADEEGFPRKGTIDFVDNRVDPNSVSVWLRGVFPNPDRLLTPGLFVRVRLPVGDPYDAVLIPERALATDQGQKFVYVVNDKNEARYHRVQVGEQHSVEIDGQPQQYRVITKGVKQGEKVIVSGQQKVRIDSKTGSVEVKPEPDEKASDGAAAKGAAGKAAGGA